MKKFNAYEALLIKDGLDKVKEGMIEEVKRIEASGKTPIMTVGFVEMTVDELLKKVEEMTKKVK